jgi:mannitol/fructose-specific phosphotransferase system IIA component (Ntr-type)
VHLRQLVDPSLVFTDLRCADRDSVLRELADRLQSSGAVPDAGDLYRKLLERESLGSTAIGHGVAIPHCKLRDLQRAVVAVGVVGDGVDVGAPDREPVRLFFLVVSPEASPAEHLQSLAAIAKWLKDTGNRERIRRAQTPEEVSASLRYAAEGAQGA